MTDEETGIMLLHAIESALGMLRLGQPSLAEITLVNAVEKLHAESTEQETVIIPLEAHGCYGDGETDTRFDANGYYRGVQEVPRPGMEDTPEG